jgi:hypothetical protein
MESTSNSQIPAPTSKFGVWCARRIVEPVVVNHKINCKIYVQVILGQFFPELTEEERLCGWFQQDSATAHAARISMEPLSEFFEKRIISSGIWPARSRELNPGFFFWGCF